MKLALLAVAACCALLLAGGAGGGRDGTPEVAASAAPVHPAAPAPYRIPRNAVRVSSAAGLRKALAEHRRRSIVLAPGTYGGAAPFLNPHGHRLYGARLGKAILKAGVSLGGNQGRGGGLVRGLVVDVRDPRRTVEAAAITIWGEGSGSRVLDTTIRGHGTLNAGIAAHRPEGLVIRRVVVRRFRDFGVFVDANDPDRPLQRQPFEISDLDVADVGRPSAGSSMGRAEACVWIGDAGSVRRLRARSCAWSGLWTGTATRRSHFESIDVDRARTGVYIEHFTSDSTFRRLRIGSGVRVGLTAEWADPAWNRRPASVGNVIEDSRFESRLAGVYLDEGTTRTTVRRSLFLHQSWGAIGDYQGSGNAFYGNDYRGVDPGAGEVRHDHLSSAREG